MEGKGRTSIQDSIVQLLALSPKGRLEDICPHFKGRTDVILLQGTTAKDWTDEGKPTR